MIHPLQVLSGLDPVRSEDPLKRAGNLEALRNSMGQGLIQQQTIAQNNDAAKARQAGIAADAEVGEILKRAVIGEDGSLDANTESALVKNGSPHAQAILTNISTVSGRKSNIQRDKDLTAQEAANAAEALRHNQATESASAAEAARRAAMPVILKTPQGSFQKNEQTGEYALIEGTAPLPKERPSQLLTPQEEAQQLRLHPPANTQTREHGKLVTSGDANRLADFETGVNDLTTLRGTISEAGATGTRAKIGAMIPNAITDLTGWGTDAKQKQAVIDRVKQVIGKTLEGGVLRREDEYKYEKILPTIADTAAVVKTKIDGLEAAIKQRKLTLLDSLDDAGYETASYRDRLARAGKAGIVIDPAGVEHQVSDVEAAIKLHPGTRRK